MNNSYKDVQDYVNAGVVPIMPMLAKEEKREDVLLKMLYSTEYIAEDKLDGVRATLHFGKDSVRVFSRRISKKTGWYTENTDSLPHIRDLAIPELEGTILDAELTIPGRPFIEVSGTMNCNSEKAVKRQLQLGKVVAHVFDCIYYKEDSIEQLDLLERKKKLSEVMKLLDTNYIEEVRYFDNKRGAVINIVDRHRIEEKKETYPTLYRELTKECGLDECRALKTDIFHLNKQAYYEYFVMQGGEGIMLKAKDGKYLQKRGREYTKVKKYTTKDVVITDFNPPTREYKGKNTSTWRYWEDPVTMIRVDFKENEDHLGHRVLYTELSKEIRDRLEPITKFHYKDWIGTICFSVAVTQEELETWEAINPKEEAIITIIDDVMYLEIGETSGLTELERQNFSENQEEYIGFVIEVKAHEVIQKTGRLRHPRYMRNREDKSPETCTIIDHLG